MPLLTPHVPDGLIDLMKDLTKEVLREKPENTFQFAANYFDKLLQKRDGSLNKNYERFVLYEEAFRGKQLFEIPSNFGFICARADSKKQQTKPKSEAGSNIKTMKSINEEDVFNGDHIYKDEKYEKAIYVIQRYYRRFAAKKKAKEVMDPSPVGLTAAAAALIIQRTMRRLFSNKIKLEKDNGNEDGNDNAKPSGMILDDMDNVSEAASYTSSSTIQMLADSQDGKENRLVGRDVVTNTVADNGSTEFKEQMTVAQDQPVPSPQLPQVAEKNSEVPPSVTTTASVLETLTPEPPQAIDEQTTIAVETNKKSMPDENGNIPLNHEEKAPTDHPIAPVLDVNPGC